MKSILLLMTIGLSNASWAQDLWINSDPSSQAEFEAFIASESDSALSFSLWSLKQQQEKVKSRNSLQSFALLQADYLSKPLEELPVIFENYINDLLVGPIGESERKQVHYAMLRRAQLSKGSSESADWIIKSIQFAPDLEIETELFPPSLVEHFNTLKRHLPLETIYLPSLFPEARFWILNGRLIDTYKTSRISINKGTPLSIQIFSDSRFPFDWKGPVEDLKSIIRQQSRTLVEGECGRYQLKSDFSEKFNSKNFEFKIFENRNCKNTLAQFKPQNRSVNLESASELKLPQTKDPWLKGEPKTSFLKSKWFWIGTGLVAAAIVIHKQNQSSSSEPEVLSSTTYGILP